MFMAELLGTKVVIARKGHGELETWQPSIKYLELNKRRKEGCKAS
jgi:hypothetical protein